MQVAAESHRASVINNHSSTNCTDTQILYKKYWHINIYIYAYLVFVRPAVAQCTPREQLKNVKWTIKYTITAADKTKNPPIQRAWKRKIGESSILMVVTLTLLGSTEFRGSVASRMSTEEGFGRSDKNGGKNSNTSTRKQVFQKVDEQPWLRKIGQIIAPKFCQLRMSDPPSFLTDVRLVAAQPHSLWLVNKQNLSGLIPRKSLQFLPTSYCYDAKSVVVQNSQHLQ